MGLETELSGSAQLDRRSRILRRLLLGRRAELRKSWTLISAGCFNSLGSLGAEVDSFLSGPDFIPDRRVSMTSEWMSCDASLSDCIYAIVLAKRIEYCFSDERPVYLSPTDFRQLSTNDRFKALSIRYRCPLNIGSASEFDIAEELLRQLMVTDRVKLERGAEFDVDEVLLKLNLVGIRAMITHDLRFFDALNYFYELPKRLLSRMCGNPTLFAFFLCLYAQLLCIPEW